MITKTHAQIRTHDAVERIRVAAQLKIDAYFADRERNKESAAMASIFENIDDCVKRACDKGYSSFSISCMSFGADEKIARERHSTVSTLLRELGYTVSFSCSYAWMNERLTVSWIE